MYKVRRVYGQWEQKHLDILKKYGIPDPNYGFLGITEDHNYTQIIGQLKDAKYFNISGGMIHFDETELNNANRYLLHNFGPPLAYASRIGKDDEGFGYLQYAFGEICPKFGTPRQEQIRPITLAKEPKLSKKYIWGGFHGISGYVFTDLERFEILNKKWGLGKREVLIGAKQKVSQEFVQIEIPISKSPLCFGNSDFGRTLKLDGNGDLSETFTICPYCGNPIYTNQILDYFPTFKKYNELDIVFTQEYFEYFRRLVISRKFADWLRENNYLEWNSNYIIPVKDFCKSNENTL